MAADAVQVCVVYSPAPREVREWHLRLPAGSTVADAIAASGVCREFAGIDAEAMTIGVWGHKATPAQPLRDRDRIELYRPLKVDPKIARRERFRRQGARAAGLFARKRDG